MTAERSEVNAIGNSSTALSEDSHRPLRNAWNEAIETEVKSAVAAYFTDATSYRTAAIPTGSLGAQSEMARETVW